MKLWRLDLRNYLHLSMFERNCVSRLRHAHGCCRRALGRGGSNYASCGGDGTNNRRDHCSVEDRSVLEHLEKRKIVAGIEWLQHTSLVTRTNTLRSGVKDAEKSIKILDSAIELSKGAAFASSNAEIGFYWLPVD